MSDGGPRSASGARMGITRAVFDACMVQSRDTGNALERQSRDTGNALERFPLSFSSPRKNRGTCTFWFPVKKSRQAKRSRTFRVRPIWQCVQRGSAFRGYRNMHFIPTRWRSTCIIRAPPSTARLLRLPISYGCGALTAARALAVARTAARLGSLT